jgi:hypothetical protein
MGWRSKLAVLMGHAVFLQIALAKGQVRNKWWIVLRGAWHMGQES